MRPSVWLELAGFAAVSVAAWLLEPIAGVFTAGFSLILAGCALEDDRAVFQLRHITGLIEQRRARKKIIKATKKAAKTSAKVA